jgi:glycosyltransferase involved in cell wall biosynthesis
MPRAELLGLLRGTDAVVIPLRRNDLFKGAIPSKIFEALALGKPLLLGVEGEAKKLFIDEGGAGLAFMPEDAEDLARCVERLAVDRVGLQRMGANGAHYVPGAL